MIYLGDPVLTQQWKPRGRFFKDLDFKTLYKNRAVSDEAEKELTWNFEINVKRNMGTWKSSDKKFHVGHESKLRLHIIFLSYC